MNRCAYPRGSEFVLYCACKLAVHNPTGVVSGVVGARSKDKFHSFAGGTKVEVLHV
jgi:hypothetical protein